MVAHSLCMQGRKGTSGNQRRDEAQGMGRSNNNNNKNNKKKNRLATECGWNEGGE